MSPRLSARRWLLQAAWLLLLPAMFGARASSHQTPPLGLLALQDPRAALFPGSRLPLSASGSSGPVHFAVVGPGRIEGTTYVAPTVSRPQRATILAAAPDAAGRVDVTIAPWPHGSEVVAVACYDVGLALHRASDGALLGVLALDGGIGDVARLGDALVAPSTTAPVMWSIDLATGAARATQDVPTGNEIAAWDDVAYVTNRDVGGKGSLTRVLRGAVARTFTGDTAEGLALDPARGLAYVANVNDPSVVAVDVRAMRVVRRYAVPERPFSIALDRSAGRIDVVSNVPQTAARRGGAVVSIDLSRGTVAARSAAMRFPLGIALDAARGRAYVTDEADGVVSVLDARSLRPVHRPLKACRTPWRPALDLERHRLYVPCAGSSRLAVFDLRTLEPLPGSPFTTGGYPLGAAPVNQPLP